MGNPGRQDKDQLGARALRRLLPELPPRRMPRHGRVRSVRHAGGQQMVGSVGVSDSLSVAARQAPVGGGVLHGVQLLLGSETKSLGAL